MPVEIKELIIRAVVTDEQENGQTVPATPMSADDKDDIIEACVKQVLQILRKSKER